MEDPRLLTSGSAKNEAKIEKLGRFVMVSTVRSTVSTVQACVLLRISNTIDDWDYPSLHYSIQNAWQ